MLKGLCEGVGEDILEPYFGLYKKAAKGSFRF